MGIEAFCPNGHRMKVKDHLAGRLGVCPTCGSRFRLPDVSVAPTPAQELPVRDAPAMPGAMGLPLAQTLSLDPMAIPNLPGAVPYPGPGSLVDSTTSAPPAAAPTTTAPRTHVQLGAVPLGSMPAGGSATNRSVPVSSVPLGSAQVGPVPPESGWPGGSSPADPSADWAASMRSPRVSRRRVRDSGGAGLSLALVAMVVVAAAVAWMILQSRGVM